MNFKILVQWSRRIFHRCPGPYKKRSFAMKLMTAILLLFQVSVYANGLAQITMSYNKAPLERVMQDIKKQSGYDFVINVKALDVSKPVTVQFTNKSLEEALTFILRDQPLSYEIENKIITIKISRKDKVKTEKVTIDQQQKNINGVVTDSLGKPLAGVTVKIKGTSKVTVSDENGAFRFNDVLAPSVLQLSYVGYKSTESLVGHGEVKIILLREHNTIQIVDVTINTGYQRVSAERQTGSFVQVDSSLFNRSVSMNVTDRLKGIVSGLIFDNRADNDLGISIRGRSTIVSNTRPLVVVDNFPYDGDISNINPNDIASVSILKDASAASIWGTLAGNGVIVITTKKGNYREALSINLNSNVTVTGRPDLTYSREFLNAKDYLDVEKLLFDNGFYDGDIGNTFSYPAITPGVELFLKEKSGAISAQDAANQYQYLSGLDVRKDLERYFYRPGLLQQYSLNAKGGSEKVNYYFSSGFDKNRLIETGNSLQRLNLNSTINVRLLKDLELSAGINLSLHNNDNNSKVYPYTGPGAIYPYARFADEQGNPLALNRHLRQSYIDEAPAKGLLDWSESPLREQQISKNNNSLTDIRINTGLHYNFLNGFSADVKYQYQKGINQRINFFDLLSFTVRNRVNRFSVLESEKLITRNVPLGAIEERNENVLLSHSGRAQLNYAKSWHEHELSAMMGVEVRETRNNGLGSQLYGYDPEIGTSQPVNYATMYPTLPSGGLSYIPGNRDVTGTLDRFRSYFGNASYTYRKKYTAYASARLDQSNLFGVNANQRGVPLWSSGLKWDIAKEGFYRSGLIPVLSLKASYGYNGNINKMLSSYTVAQYITNSSVPSFTYAWVMFPGNPDLGWERVRTFNLGSEFHIRDFVEGSLELYWKKGLDLIGNSPVATSSGFEAATGNFANIKGHGFDLTLTSHNLKKTLFWNTTLLLSHSVDKVTKYKGGITSAISLNIIEGNPFYSVYPNRFGGLDDQGDPLGYLNGELSKDYTSLNNIPNTERKAYNLQPQFFGALRNDFSYKNFSLSFNLTFKAKYYFSRSSTNYVNLFNSGIGNSDFVHRWQKPGDELVTNVPSLKYPLDYGRESFYSYTDVLMERGAHIRLQDISLGYTLSRKNISSLPLREIHFYGYLSNLGIIWRANKYKIDPDALGSYVAPTSFSFGVKIGI